MLFPQALKGGGLYIIEDLQVARHHLYTGKAPENFNTLDMIKDWLEELARAEWVHRGASDYMAPGAASYTRYRYPARMKGLDCAAEMCAFVKCLADDPDCPAPRNRSNTSRAL